MKYVIYLFLLSCSAMNIHAQNADSTIFSTNLYANELERLDTSLNHFYTSNSFQNFSNTNLGNIHSASISPSYYEQNDFHFRFKPSVYSSSYYNESQLRFYNTKKPFTQVSYRQLKLNEQMLNVLFTANFNKRWNISFDYFRNAVAGQYLQQKTGVHRFAFTSDFVSKNKRYEAKIFSIINAVEMRENGGIANDTLVEQNILLSRNIVPVQLNDGVRNKERNNTLGILHSYYFNNDSTQKFRFSLQHYYTVHFYKFHYLDKNPAQSYYGSLYNTDSVWSKTTAQHNTNEVHIVANTGSWQLKSGIGYEHYIQKQLYATRFTQLYLSNDALFTKKNIQASIKLRNTIDMKRYDASAQFTFRLWNDITLQTSVASIKKPQYLFFRHFVYNHDTAWISNAADITQQLFSVQLLSKKIGVSLEAQQLITQHFAMLNATFTPTVYSNAKSSNIILRTNHHIRFLHFDNIIQYSIRNDSVFLFPKLFAKSSLYAEHFLFKRALLARYGVEGIYMPNSVEIGWQPLFQSFYYKSNHSKKYTPELNIFISAKIQTVRFYFRIDNVLSGVTHQINFLAPNYPLRDRVFNFGINWNLWN